MVRSPKGKSGAQLIGRQVKADLARQSIEIQSPPSRNRFGFDQGGGTATNVATINRRLNNGISHWRGNNWGELTRNKRQNNSFLIFNQAARIVLFTYKDSSFSSPVTVST